MIRLLVRGEAVDLFPETTITIEEESPVFDPDSIPGGYSFPFSLPVTPRNRRVFDFPERVQNSKPFGAELPFMLYQEGILKASGTINIMQAGSQYKANLRCGTGDLAGKIKNKKLKDLDLGGERTWEFRPEYSYPECDFALFPIYNPDFSLYTKDPAYILNHHRLNAYENGSFSSTFVVSPFPFIVYLVRKVFEQHGFQIVENALETNPDLRDLVLYSNWDITTQHITYEMVYTFLGVDQYREEVWEWLQQATGGRVQDKWQLEDCLPDMLISDFLLSLRVQFNLAFVIDGYNRVSIIQRQDLLHRPVERDLTNQAIGTPEIFSVPKMNGFTLAWEHDSNDLIFKETFQKIEDYLQYIGEPVSSIAALTALDPQPLEIRFVTSMDRYYRYQPKDEEGPAVYTWKEFSIGFQNYFEGNREQVFQSKFSTLLMIHYQRLSGGSFIRCPYARQQGNCSDAATFTQFSPRLLFYRGMQPDSQNNPVPTGSSDNLDRTGQPFPGKHLSLRWEGESGIFNQLWKDYLTWWMNRKQVTWTLVNAANLQFGKIYTICGCNYILKKRTVTLNDNQVHLSNCELYLV